MRLIFLSNVFPNPLAPGKGTFNSSLVSTLALRDTVRVISPVSWTDQLRRKGTLPRDTTELGTNLTANFPTYYFTPRLFRSWYGDFMNWSIGPTVARAIAEIQPQAFLSYWAHPDGDVAVRHARRIGVPALTMVGGSDVLLLARSGLRRRRILQVLQRSDRILAVSDDIANRLERDGISHEKIRVIRRGVEQRLFFLDSQAEARTRLGLPAARKIVIAVGRLVGVKGFDRLILALKQLADRGEDLLGFILGTGELQGSLQKQIETLGLQEKVFLPGNQTQERLADWYRAADLTLLTSWSEGVPNVLLESIACGTPFVATNVGGVAEIADPQWDRLVPAGDVTALAGAIGEQLHRPRLMNQSRRYQPISWEASADLIRSEIGGCLGLNCEASTARRELLEVVS